MAGSSKPGQKDQGLRRIREDLEWSINQLSEVEKLPHELTRLYKPRMTAQIEEYKKTIECIEERKPVLASYWSICPEVYRAMDIHYYCIQGYHFQQSQADFVMDDLEACDALGLAQDNCSLLRLALYYIQSHMVPKPTMIIHKLEPCDALLGFHEAVRVHKEWSDLPFYSLDPPYWEDDRTFEYYASEMRGVVTFLEENTGKKLDLDRLREVLEESNKQYELWAEYDELKRMVPCPHGFDLSSQLYPMVQMLWSGEPRCTEWLRELVADAEERVREKRGWLDHERFRILWFEVFGFWLRDLALWLEKEWGASIVMDMSTYCPYTSVDTTNENTIFRDLGKRTICDQIMIRQVRGPADRLLGDLQRLVKDFSIDGVIPPNHVGHKDQLATLGLMRELCRDLGTAFLDLGRVDIFDPRFTTMDEIQERLSRYFSVMESR
jgi:benzoyl-CoA reductase/2-hydroxyglutaryl-CoA dehydratase subunit BcrC/BadD/HgdB